MKGQSSNSIMDANRSISILNPQYVVSGFYHILVHQLIVFTRHLRPPAPFSLLSTWSHPHTTLFAMSRALTIATAILTIFYLYVSAQAPICDMGFTWVHLQLERSCIKFLICLLQMFNSNGQSPCTLAQQLGGACDNSSKFFVVNILHRPTQ